MTTWRYTAMGASGLVRGEHAGESPGEVRCALHRVGLRVLDLKPLQRGTSTPIATPGLWASLRRRADLHLRARRRMIKAELLDAVATMLESGVPLVECAASIAGSTSERSARALLARLRDQLQGGLGFADAIADHPSWFDGAEAAMARAGERSGELPGVLRSLADRHSRSGELAGRLASALTYPAIVAAVGVGVVIFLSTRTLPELAQVLEESGKAIPPLTAWVMALGRFLLAALPTLTVVLGVLPVFWLAWATLAPRFALHPPRWPCRLTPVVVRRAAVAEMLLALAELLRAGVPAVEALRSLAPAAGGAVGAPLGQVLSRGADRVERGEPISGVFADRRWFPEEIQRLVRVGEHAGELHAVLERLGHRYRRSARRRVDRLSGLLEPAVILILSVGVGTVVMAAVLPLVRLQEVL